MAELSNRDHRGKGIGIEEGIYRIKDIGVECHRRRRKKNLVGIGKY